MVLLIPTPSLTDLLPAFLSHVPASFTSPKPPPSLPPLLTPLTRSRLQHLAFNISGSDSSWLSLLTWSSDPSDSQTLHDHLSSQDYYFLHQPPSPNTFLSKGYRRLDPETLQTLISVPELELIIIYQFITDDILSESGNVGNSWKVHDVRLADGEEALLPAGEWHGSIDAAEEKFRECSPIRSGVSNLNIGNSPGQEIVDDEDDDDDYWGRYDEEDTESSVGDQDRNVSQNQSPVQIAANVLARRVMQDTNEEKDESEYFARYADVEPVLDQNPTAAPTAPVAAAIRPEERRDSVSTNPASNYDLQTTLSTPITMFTQSSTTISPMMASKTHQRKVAELEGAAELHTQNEVAIKQHVSTSVKSLYRLWKAGGMEGEDFGRFLEREVEVLRIVEEADGGLGS